MTNILESRIEKHLDETVKKMGGFTRKTVYQGRKAAPDRQVFLPGGIIWFMELKRPGEKPRRDQEAELELLRKNGFKVAVIDTMLGVDVWAEDARC